MRKVIVNRIKALAGCAGKVSIYISQTLEEELEITKDKCEFIGKIKNGASLEFEIIEDEIVLIAAYDNIGVFMPTDYVIVPKGRENIVINGKVKLNPIKGNPFIFMR